MIALLSAAVLVTSASSPGKEARKAGDGRLYVTAQFLTPSGGCTTFCGNVFANRSNAIVSLHGLEPKTRYQVLASQEPCSAVDPADPAIWRVAVRTGSGDDLFAIDNSIADGPQRFQVSDIKSLYVVNDAMQTVCAKATILKAAARPGAGT
jgi:hypothetical protein